MRKHKQEAHGIDPVPGPKSTMEARLKYRAAQERKSAEIDDDDESGSEMSDGHVEGPDDMEGIVTRVGHEVVIPAEVTVPGPRIVRVGAKKAIGVRDVQGQRRSFARETGSSNVRVIGKPSAQVATKSSVHLVSKPNVRKTGKTIFNEGKAYRGESADSFDVKNVTVDNVVTVPNVITVGKSATSVTAPTIAFADPTIAVTTAAPVTSIASRAVLDLDEIHEAAKHLIMDGGNGDVGVGSGAVIGQTAGIVLNDNRQLPQRSFGVSDMAAQGPRIEDCKVGMLYYDDKGSSYIVVNPP